MGTSPDLANPLLLAVHLCTRLDSTSLMPRDVRTRRNFCMKPNSRLSRPVEADQGPCLASGASARLLPNYPFLAHGMVLLNRNERDLPLFRSKLPRRPQVGVFHIGRNWKKCLGLRGSFGSLSDLLKPCQVDLLVGQGCLLSGHPLLLPYLGIRQGSWIGS
jgi:hypothetical protein